MNYQPKVSVIIPLYVISSRFFVDLRKFTTITYPNFEVLVVSDTKVFLPKTKFSLKLVLTGQSSTGPAEKRDIAIKASKGDICAFIDDDAYPDRDWLKHAIKWFKNPDIQAVGGPGVTPREDSWFCQIGGHIVSSYFCSGGIQHRYYVNSNTKPAFIDDWPAYNLLIRKSALKKVGGFASTFYGGEDTYICIKLSQLGLLVFDPKVLVYHHRRAFPLGHLKQISNVGIHRGYFFKKYPETSRKIIYTLPTLLTTLLLCGLTLSVVFPHVFLLPFLLVLLTSTLAAYVSVSRHNVSITQAIVSAVGILLTHVVYGISFIKGFFLKNLIR